MAHLLQLFQRTAISLSLESSVWLVLDGARVLRRETLRRWRAAGHGALMLPRTHHLLLVSIMRSGLTRLAGHHALLIHHAVLRRHHTRPHHLCKRNGIISEDWQKSIA